METKPFFTIDRRERKLLGVCSGLGNRFGIDPTFIRIAWIAVPLLTFVTVWQALIAYIVVGVIGGAAQRRTRNRSTSEFEQMDEVGKGRHSIHDVRTKLDETDRRMMAIDHHLHTQNDELAREIEALRKEETK